MTHNFAVGHVQKLFQASLTSLFKSNLWGGFRRTFIGVALFSSVSFAQMGRWDLVASIGKDSINPREECSFSQAGGKFYLLGGRGINPVQEYTPSTKKWVNLKNTPLEMHHFQALAHAGLIYVMGAFTGAYPEEKPIPNIYIYDPLSDNWIKGSAIPEARLRGSTGLVEYKNKFYLVVGNKLGHVGPSIVYLDEFDPATNTWTSLPDAPRGRDHFQAAVTNGKIYAIGGRQSINKNAIFTDLEKVDVYDIDAKNWMILPTASDFTPPRSGGVVAQYGNEIIYAGGSNTAVNDKTALNFTLALNTLTNTWRPLANMNFGRQVTGGFVNNSGFYVASGSGGTGGGPTLKSMEVFFMNETLPPTGDALVAGKLAPADTSFNMGIITSGQSLSKQFQLRHIAGNQGVVISALAVTGDPAFKLKTTVTAPYLVRPGQSSSVEITFTSAGSAPAASFLEVTYAIPPGATLKVPLDANRTPAAVLVRSIRPNPRSMNGVNAETPLYQKGSKPGHWNALGKKKMFQESGK